MRDEVVAGGLVLAFATLVTAHVMLVAALGAPPRRWHALVALVAPPLAPFWGWRRGLRARAGVWVAAAFAYVALRWLASR